MNEQEALKIVAELVNVVSNKPTVVALQSDLREDGLLDSLDTLVFFMELEKKTGLSIPDTEELLEQGWYKVSKLCTELVALSSKSTPN